MVNDLKKEKQELSERLTDEREEYMSAFKELEQVKQTQSVRLEQSQKEIDILNKQNEVNEKEMKRQNDTIERLTSSYKEAEDRFKMVEQSLQAVQLSKEQQNEIIQSLRREHQEKDERMRVLYEENMSLQRRIDTDIIHKASQYAQSQMSVLTSINNKSQNGSMGTYNVYKRQSSKKEFRPMSFSSQGNFDPKDVHHQM